MAMYLRILSKQNACSMSFEKYYVNSPNIFGQLWWVWSVKQAMAVQRVFKMNLGAGLPAKF